MRHACQWGDLARLRVHTKQDGRTILRFCAAALRVDIVVSGAGVERVGIGSVSVGAVGRRGSTLSARPEIPIGDTTPPAAVTASLADNIIYIDDDDDST